MVGSRIRTFGAIRPKRSGFIVGDHLSRGMEDGTRKQRMDSILWRHRDKIIMATKQAQVSIDLTLSKGHIEAMVVKAMAVATIPTEDIIIIIRDLLMEALLRCINNRWA